MPQAIRIVTRLQDQDDVQGPFTVGDAPVWDGTKFVAGSSGGGSGSSFYFGSGVPSNGLGMDGDVYIRTTNGDYYQKSSGAWGSPIISGLFDLAGAAASVQTNLNAEANTRDSADTSITANIEAHKLLTVTAHGGIVSVVDRGKARWIFDDDAARAAVQAALTTDDLDGWGWQKDNNLAYMCWLYEGEPHFVPFTTPPLSIEDNESVFVFPIGYFDVPPGGVTDEGGGGVALNYLVPLKNLSDVPDKAAARANLGLGTAATHATTDYDSAGAASTVQGNLTTHSTLTDMAHGGVLLKSDNLASLGNAGTARANLGLGTASTKDTGTGSGQVPLLDGSGKIPVALLPASVVGALEYQGVWNATTNSPALASSTGTKGYYYKVSVAGTTSLDGIAEWAVGDWVVFNGSTWDKLDNTDLVSSVAGRIGAVTLSNTDISGLGSAALVNTGTTSGTIPILDGSGRITTLMLPTDAALLDAINAYTAAQSIIAGATDAATLDALLNVLRTHTFTSNNTNTYYGMLLENRDVANGFKGGNLYGLQLNARMHATAAAQVASIRALVANAETDIESTSPVNLMYSVNASTSHRGLGLASNVLGGAFLAALKPTGGAVDGNITTATGVSGTIQNTSNAGTPGIITAAHAIWAVSPTGPGAITTIQGLYVSNQGASFVTNAYGLYIEAQSGAGTLNYAIYTNAGLVRLGDFTSIELTNAVTNTVSPVLQLRHRSSGTPAAGFGSSLLFTLNDATVADKSAAAIIASWPATPTDGSQKARVTFNVYDTAIREAIRIEASGTAPMLGFYGGNAVVKPAVTGDRVGNAALASALTQLASQGLVTDSTTDSGAPAAGAPNTTPYITTASDAGLSAEVAIPGLAADADIKGNFDGSAAGGISEEYDTSTTGLTWTPSNPTTVDSNTTVKSHLYVKVPLDGTERIGTRAWSPAGAFDARMKVYGGSDIAGSGMGPANMHIGNSANTTRVLLQIQSNIGSLTLGAFVYSSGSYGSNLLGGGSGLLIYQSGGYLRITRDASTNITFWFSPTGKPGTWHNLATTSLSITVANIGHRAVGSVSGAIYMICDWLRTNV